MRPILLVMLAMAPGGIAQDRPNRPAVDWDRLSRMADAVRSAIDAHDVERTSKAVSALSSQTVADLVTQAGTPAERLRDMETLAATSPVRPYRGLNRLAKTAFEAGELTKAELWARELLASAATSREPAVSIHDGNMVLGRIALKKGDVASARAYLLAAGKIRDVPSYYREFGPNMELARELVEKGEFDTVLEYLTACRSFWTGKWSYRLEDWIALVRGRRKPSFVENRAL